MQPGRKWRGMVAVGKVNHPPTQPGEEPSVERGRVFYARARNGGAIDPKLPDDTVEEIRQEIERLCKSGLASCRGDPINHVVRLLIGSQDLKRMLRPPAAAIKVDRTKIIARFAEMYLDKYLAEITGREKLMTPIPRPRIPSDISPKLLWYVPLVENDSCAVAGFTRVVDLLGDVPDFIKQLMAEWDPLALLWLVSDDASRAAVLEVHAACRAAGVVERVQPRPGTWPRLRDQGAALLESVQYESQSLRGQPCALRSPDVDLGVAPLWRYFPPGWAKNRYAGAGWGSTPVDCSAADLARAFSDAPKIFAAQRAYALARLFLLKAFQKAWNPSKPGLFAAPDPAEQATTAKTANWRLARPISMDKMRLLFAVMTTGREQEQAPKPDAEKITQAHAALVALYKDVFVAL